MQLRGASVTAFLSADRVEVRQFRGLLRRHVAETATEPVVRPEGVERIRACIDTLGGLLRARNWTGCDLDVVLSDEFLRFALLPTLDARLDSAEIIGLAGALFQRTYGDAVQAWTIRVCANGRRGALAAAMDNAVVDELNAFAASTSCTLRSVQPLFLHVLAHAAPELRDASWVLLNEAPVAVLALVEGGALGAIRIKRQTASAEIGKALERERRRLGSEIRSLLVLDSGSVDPVLPEGWTLRRAGQAASPEPDAAGSVYVSEQGH